MDGVNRTRDDTHMWLAPFTPGHNHLVRLQFSEEVTIAMIRIWVSLHATVTDIVDKMGDVLHAVLTTSLYGLRRVEALPLHCAVSITLPSSPSLSLAPPPFPELQQVSDPLLSRGPGGGALPGWQAHLRGGGCQVLIVSITSPPTCMYAACYIHGASHTVSAVPHTGLPVACREEQKPLERCVLRSVA